MKNILLFGCILLFSCIGQAADVAISGLTAAGALGGTEVAPVVQSGTTKKATIDQIKTYVTTGYATAGTITTGNLCRATSSTQITCDVDTYSEVVTAVSDISTATQTLTNVTLDLAGVTSYTWSGRPTASSYSGKIIRISNVGLASVGSLWISNGTVWRPMNGHVTLCSRDTAASHTGDTNETVKYSCTIPAGLLQTGDRIQIRYTSTKNNTTNTCAGRIRAGTAGTTSDATLYTDGTAMTSSTDNISNLLDFMKTGSTTVRKLGANSMLIGVYSGANSNDVSADTTISDMDASDLLLSYTILLGNTGLTCSLVDMTVDLRATNN